MKENEFLDSVSNMEADVVERFIAMDGQLRRKANKSKAKSRWLRFGAIAACFLLIVGAITVMPMLREDDPVTTKPPHTRVPSVSTITSGNTVTGMQELVYGDFSSGSAGDAVILAPGFYIHTVVHANVVEVLSDTFYAPDSRLPCHVARLSVVESIRGEGLPQEIFLSFPHYNTDIFDGYDTFIFSLHQIGVENYMMINDTKHEVTYFSHMFTVATISDPGYGSVIAFNDEKVDESFWDKANYYSVGGYIDRMLSNPTSYLYPVGRNSTISEAKANIRLLAEKDESESMFVSHLPCDYVTASDIFVSDVGKQISEYLEPSESGVFMHEIAIREDRVVATYTRVVNGFLTDEIIVINGYTGENGNVSRSGEAYTAEDLAKMPNIGEVIQSMKPAELKPTHIELVDGMQLRYLIATGVYRKVEGKIYGIVRVIWRYTYPETTSGFIMDDCYYLYDQEGNGSIVERNELEELLGNDSIIARFSYNGFIEFD